MDGQFQEHLFPKRNHVSSLINRVQMITYLLRISVPTAEVICMISHSPCLTKRKVSPLFWIGCTNNLGYLLSIPIWHRLDNQEQKLPINTSNMNRFSMVGPVSSKKYGGQCIHTPVQSWEESSDKAYSSSFPKKEDSPAEMTWLVGTAEKSWYPTYICCKILNR